MADLPQAPLISTALRCRCPRCGEGQLFDGYLTIRPVCPMCGLSLANVDTADGPAFLILMPLCLVTAGLALFIERFFAPPAWVHFLIWPVFIGVVVGFSLRPVKALMVGLQYRYRSVV